MAEHIEVDLNYSSHGAKEGTRVLFLSPFFTSAETWKRVLPAFARYEAVLVEYPGFGPRPARPMESVEEISQRIASLLDGLPPKPLHIVGYSFGSWIAQYLAARPVAGLRSLTLLGSSDRIYQMGIAMTDEWLRLLDGIGMEAVVAQIGFWSFSPQTFERTPQVLARYVQGTINACPRPEVLRNHLEVLKYHRGIDRTRLRVPTLLLRGEADVLCPRFCSLALKDSIAGSRMVEVPETGHALLWENPTVVVESITRFLQECEDAPAGA